MSWKIEFDSEVEKDLKKLGREAQKRILEYLKERIAKSNNPRDFGKPLRGKLSGFWRYRVGDYRLICRIFDEEILVLVIKAGHRKNIYLR